MNTGFRGHDVRCAFEDVLVCPQENAALVDVGGSQQLLSRRKAERGHRGPKDNNLAFKSSFEPLQTSGPEWQARSWQYEVACVAHRARQDASQDVPAMCEQWECPRP